LIAAAPPLQTSRFDDPRRWEWTKHKRKGDRMYIGGGFIALILIILLLIWLF
jgi:hypothetical protein